MPPLPAPLVTAAPVPAGELAPLGKQEERILLGTLRKTDGNEDCDRGERVRLRDLVGRLLASSSEWPLAQREAYSAPTGGASGGS